MSEFNSVLNQKAVALKYDEARDSAPVIVASGSGYMAEKIVELANETGVPVYEDNSLATILSQLEQGREIPQELYKTIVDIYVYFLKFVPQDKPALEQPAQIKAVEAQTVPVSPASRGSGENAQRNVLSGGRRAYQRKED